MQKPTEDNEFGRFVYNSSLSKRIPPVGKRSVFQIYTVEQALNNNLNEIVGHKNKLPIDRRRMVSNPFSDG